MKKTTQIITMALGLSAMSTQAAIVAGDTLSIDFGSIASTQANLNTGIVNSGSTTASNLVRLSDGASTDVSLAIAGTGGTPGNNTSVFADGSASGGSADANIFGDGIILAGTGDDAITLTFSGLDDSLSYNLFAGGQTGANDFGANWTIGGQSQATSFQDTVPFVNFSGVSSVGGEIVLTINDISDLAPANPGRNVGLSELTLTAAVPEPSSTALLGLGGLALILRRRR